MGSLATTGITQHLVYPGTPPELVSPSASSYASISAPSEARTVGTGASTSPTMSVHDKVQAAEVSPVMKREDSAHSRPDSSSASAAHRQQLPSLSSLFGPPSGRPLNSPVSDRAAAFTTSSPLDRPRITSADRTASGSYFSQGLPTSMSQPRSTLDGKLESADRPSLHPLKRTFSGSSSPGYREFGSARPDSRAEADGSSKWAVHHDANKQEYTFGSREHHFRPSQEHFRLHFPGSRDAQMTAYPDQRSGHPNPLPTPASTINSEGMSKDGLGPKIWTGSHFLPRFVRAADVPGEGLCYFYDDGSHCKTVIDGEAVNAHWGVTKAGKPRKRLAIACMTCREKKIKCDPDYPRCVQCEKFGRICKFKNAPRGGHNGSPTTPPAELDDLRRLGGQIRPGEYGAGDSDSGSPISPRTALPNGSPEESSHKRLKLEGSRYQTGGESYGSASQALDHSKAEFPVHHRPRELPRIPDNVLNRAWQTDPYVSDPQSIIAVVSHFFAQIDNTMILRILPQDATMAWVSTSAHRKTPEDLMLLYSMLAVGVALSEGPRHIAFEYAQVAHYAQKTLQLDCLQLVQSRIILALYYVSTHRLRDATDMIAAAAAAGASLQLHLEMDESVDAKRPSFPLNMTRAGFAESRRRTMWSLFMLERLSGMFPQQPAIINAEDICIRLPSESRSFEKQLDDTAPLFDPLESATRALDSTGCLIEMVHLWSSCQAAVFRQIRRSVWSGPELRRLRGLSDRLEKWRVLLPETLVFDPKNLEGAILAGKSGAFLSMHLLYRHAIIALARYGGNPNQMTRHERMFAIYKCRDNAKVILDILQAMGHAHRGIPSFWNPMPPTTTFLVSEAVDILSCGGSLASLESVIKAIDLARPAMESLGAVWENQRAAVSIMDDRLAKLRRIRDRGSEPPSAGSGYRIVQSSPGPSCNGVVWQLDDGPRSPSRELDVLFYTQH